MENFSLDSVAHQKESDFNEDFGNLVFLITAKGQCTPKTLINDKMNKNKQFTKPYIRVHRSKPLKWANSDKKLQGWRLTFELCCAGVDVHPFLAFSTTHQETGHRLTWKKCVGLCNLTTK